MDLVDELAGVGHDDCLVGDVLAMLRGHHLEDGDHEDSCFAHPGSCLAEDVFPPDADRWDGLELDLAGVEVAAKRESSQQRFFEAEVLPLS